MDVETAAVSIDHLIERRSRQKDEANAAEELWIASDRRHREERQQENLEAWACYHEHMRQLHAELAAEHANKAEALEETG